MSNPQSITLGPPDRLVCQNTLMDTCRFNAGNTLVGINAPRLDAIKAKREIELIKKLATRAIMNRQNLELFKFKKKRNKKELA